MFNPNRLKVQLKLAINRLKMLQAKKSSLSQHQRREIATLLDKGKEESARIRVEHIIRQDLVMEALEMLELYCDLLLARFGLIEQYKTCDPGIAEAVCTLIWASPRADEVKELAAIRDQFAAKYGKEFVMNALENTDSMVNERVITKLQANAPDPYLVERYLEEIAKTYNVLWVSSTGGEDDDDDDDGGLAETVKPAMEPPLLADPNLSDTSPVQAKPPSPSLDLPDIPSNLPPIKTKPASTNNSPSKDSDFDALARRLEALKRK